MKCGTCGRYANGICLLMDCETAENKAACPEYIEGKKQTCGECKHHGSLLNLCCRYADADYPGVEKGCKDFEPKVITNGDKIRQGGNRKLAIFHMWNTCDTCVYSNKSKSHNDICHCPVDKTCIDGIEAWLNAPAESEGEDE